LGFPKYRVFAKDEVKSVTDRFGMVKRLTG
jgi:hypothetical protein